MNSLAFCSISTRSHLSQSIACLSSLAEFHPDASHVLLLTDTESGFDLSLPPQITALHIGACIGPQQLSSMRALYSKSELCFAAKPFLIAHLLKAGFRQVHYLDGDCLAFSRFTPLIETLDVSDLLLTPHCLKPVPDDGLQPRPLTLLRSGAFNAGYLGVSNTSQGTAFVRWLSSMTEKFARNIPKEGLCGDQRWLDLVPASFSGAVIFRHPGANAAYWNLRERTYRRSENGDFLVNDQPLLFFHFSGYEPACPEHLSRYLDRNTHIDATLLELLELYRTRLSESARNHHLPISSSRQSYAARMIARLLKRAASTN